jgi:hypothetical protein
LEYLASIEVEAVDGALQERVGGVNAGDHDDAFWKPTSDLAAFRGSASIRAL